MDEKSNSYQKVATNFSKQDTQLTMWQKKKTNDVGHDGEKKKKGNEISRSQGFSYVQFSLHMWGDRDRHRF